MSNKSEGEGDLQPGKFFAEDFILKNWIFPNCTGHVVYIHEVQKIIGDEYFCELHYQFSTICDIFRKGLQHRYATCMFIETLCTL